MKKTKLLKYLRLYRQWCSNKGHDTTHITAVIEEIEESSIDDLIRLYDGEVV